MYTVYADITLVCWIVFYLYWAKSSSNQKETAQKSGIKDIAPYRIFWTLSFVFLAIPGLFNLASVFLPIHSAVFGVISDLVSLLGLVICILARRELAGNWAMQLDLKKDHQIIKTGPYSLMRHPIYTGFLLLFLGSALALGRVGGFVGLALLLIGTFMRIKNEETLLTKTFGKEYGEYKKHVKSLIPYVW